MQHKFALEILRRCQEEGLHTVLDTCGCTSWQIMEKLLPYTDLVLYDIKSLNSEKHLQATGKNNKEILENARKIAQLKEMWVRVPMIPGFNDSADEVRAIAEFVRKELGDLKIDLHQYNKLSESKYALLDKQAIHLDIQSDDYMQKLRNIVEST